MTYPTQLIEESPVTQSFIPATGELTMGILISVCKDVVSLSSRSLEACKNLNHTLAFHYVEWRWNQDD